MKLTIHIWIKSLQLFALIHVKIKFEILCIKVYCQIRHINFFQKLNLFFIIQRIFCHNSNIFLFCFFANKSQCILCCFYMRFFCNQISKEVWNHDLGYSYFYCYLNCQFHLVIRDLSILCIFSMDKFMIHHIIKNNRRIFNS